MFQLVLVNATYVTTVMSKYTTVTVDRHNYERLQRLGRVPESFNDVIGRLLDKVEQLEQK